jgi:hypothetical protein
VTHGGLDTRSQTHEHDELVALCMTRLSKGDASVVRHIGSGQVNGASISPNWSIKCWYTMNRDAREQPTGLGPAGSQSSWILCRPTQEWLSHRRRQVLELHNPRVDKQQSVSSGLLQIARILHGVGSDFQIAFTCQHATFIAEPHDCVALLHSI